MSTTIKYHALQLLSLLSYDPKPVATTDFYNHLILRLSLECYIIEVVQYYRFFQNVYFPEVCLFTFIYVFAWLDSSFLCSIK